MFNGIVESVGVIKDIKIINGCKHLTIIPHEKFDDLSIDDSISVNGVCLTITRIHENELYVTAVPETLRLTNLDFLEIKSLVNLERPLKVNSRIGGHYVQGHVDGMGKILEIKNEGDAWLVKMSIPHHVANYVVNKGYIALDGMSITVIQAQSDWFSVTFIPHTQDVTIVNQYQVGSHINIEVDIMGKYVEKLLGAHQPCKQ